MFLGHYALGFASKKIDKSPSLAMMFVAVQLLDFLWPIFVLLGLETFEIEAGNTVLTPLNFTFYPYSHSLLMCIVWGALLGFIYYITTKNRKGAVILLALVCSHWILDVISHRPDLPLSPFSDQKVGLGLWNYPILESTFEIGLFITGTLLYFFHKKPKRKIAFWSLIGFFLVIHVMNILGPPPPSIQAVAWSANLMWLFVIWAWWIEKEPKPKS